MILKINDMQKLMLLSHYTYLTCVFFLFLCFECVHFQRAFILFPASFETFTLLKGLRLFGKQEKELVRKINIYILLATAQSV